MSPGKSSRNAESPRLGFPPRRTLEAWPQPQHLYAPSRLWEFLNYTLMVFGAKRDILGSDNKEKLLFYDSLSRLSICKKHNSPHKQGEPITYTISVPTLAHPRWCVLAKQRRTKNNTKRITLNPDERFASLYWTTFQWHYNPLAHTNIGGVKAKISF